MSASRWAQLSATRLPVDLTEPDEDDTSDRSRKAQHEIAQIQACVDALDPRSEPATR
jgi:hypothetical protein